VGHLGGSRGLGGQRAVAALPVGDRKAGEAAHGERERPVPEPAVGEHPALAAREARAHHVVGRTGEDRAHQPLELLGGVLAVGVAERDRCGAVAHGSGEPGPHRRAEPAVGPQREHVGTGPAGGVGGAVGGAVVEDEDLEVRDPGLGEQRPHDRSDPGGLVARRDQQRHRLGHRRRVGGHGARAVAEQVRGGGGGEQRARADGGAQQRAAGGPGDHRRAA
jgi:hypothetical protein